MVVFRNSSLFLKGSGSSFAVPLFLIITAAFSINGQDLLAVLDLQCDGSLPEKHIRAVSDRISEIIAEDTIYM